jgi:hypothetical protein
MKPEDFEQKFAQHDPAALLAPMNEDEVGATVAHATSASAPQLRGPISARSKWFVGVAAATAAVVALNAPSSMVASVPVLHLSGGSSALNAAASDSKSMVAGGPGASDAMFRAYYHFTLDGSVSTTVPSETHTAYKLVPIANLDAIAADLIKYFDVTGVVESTDPANAEIKSWASGESTSTYIYIYGGPGASWSYANPALDNFVCKTVTATSNQTDPCSPRTLKNVLPAADAEAKAKNILDKLELSTGQWSWETVVDDRGDTVTGTRIAEGMKSPITVSFTFADNGEISYAWGSLETLVALGDYNIISQMAAFDRANAMTDKWVKAMNDAQTPSPQTATDDTKSAPSSGAGDSSAAVAPTTSDSPQDGSVVESPDVVTPSNFTAQEATVTDINFSMTSIWDTDGNHLWLPAYDLIGHVDASSDQWTLTSVIAIVDSQIDLSQFFNAGGVMPMMR